MRCALVVAALLAGCATEPVTVTRTVYETPPEIWLRDCIRPPFRHEAPTIGDAMIYLPQVIGVLADCNNDKRALRAWAKEVERQNGERDTEEAEKKD